MSPYLPGSMRNRQRKGQRNARKVWLFQAAPLDSPSRKWYIIPDEYPEDDAAGPGTPPSSILSRSICCFSLKREASLAELSIAKARCEGSTSIIFKSARQWRATPCSCFSSHRLGSTERVVARNWRIDLAKEQMLLGPGGSLGPKGTIRICDTPPASLLWITSQSTVSEPTRLYIMDMRVIFLLTLTIRMARERPQQDEIRPPRQADTDRQQRLRIPKALICQGNSAVSPMENLHPWSPPKRLFFPDAPPSIPTVINFGYYLKAPCRQTK